MISGIRAIAGRAPNRRHLFRPLLGALVAAVLVGPFVAGTAGGATSESTHRPSAAPVTPIWSTQLDFDDNGTPWSEASFAALRAKGLNTAEIDMPWGGIEPTQGNFTFTELDTELANANAAGIQLVPIFWYSGWGGSPAPWVTSHEVSNSGAQSTAPEWWDPNAEPAYVAYVTDTIKHIAGEAGYGGSILDYGFLDAQWDEAGGASGWASDDINEFHNTYLPQTYGSIATFNSKNGTSYSSFSQVPAATPGQALASVYQQFRVWSVQTVYGQLTSAARALTNTPLYYYYGGHIGNAVDYANIPDLFFGLAKQYTVTIIVDSAQSTGLALTFGSLARAYGVTLAQEWTAPSDSTQLAAQAVQWISNYGMGLPEGGGEDFFIHDGTQKDTVGYPIYTSWLSTLQSLSGSYPQQPVAVYVDFSAAYGNTSGGDLGSPENDITNLWNSYQAGFAVVTSQEVNAGIVQLSQYKAILPVNGVDANLTAYQSAGGTLLTANSQLSQYAPAYATLANSGVLQVVPVVAANRTSAQVTLADVNSGTSYTNSVTLNPAGLDLTSGAYHVVTASGAVVPQQVVSGGICASANVAAASLAEWNVVPGAAPAGTPTPASCAPPAACGTLTANEYLGSNGALTSCDGRFNLIMQSDGNLVLYEGSTVLWASNTVNSSATKAILQGDGNFVLYTSAGAAVWASGTSGNSGASLTVGDDGNVIIASSTGTTLWSTNTGGH
ncbi:MAG TPA: beta-galactosidase [Pseudonocardiaceae bacterium]|nr:beta-galactosidase [Pseudonocardiaceae bacterium]